MVYHICTDTDIWSFFVPVVYCRCTEYRALLSCHKMHVEKTIKSSISKMPTESTTLSASKGCWNPDAMFIRLFFWANQGFNIRSLYRPNDFWVLVFMNTYIRIGLSLWLEEPNYVWKTLSISTCTRAATQFRKKTVTHARVFHELFKRHFKATTRGPWMEHWYPGRNDVNRTWDCDLYWRSDIFPFNQNVSWIAAQNRTTSHFRQGTH